MSVTNKNKVMESSAGSSAAHRRGQPLYVQKAACDLTFRGL